MKKAITTILLAIACIMGYAQTIDPVLLQEMGQRTDDEKIKVIVIMKPQYDRQQLGRRAANYATRAERREFVVNELKQFAETSQHELRATLSEMERQDMTTAPKIIYMANALYFSATKQAINDLAMRRDIELIGLDEKKHVLFDEEPRPANMTREITSNVTQVNADQVWNLGYTGQGVVVAVIDTGVNYNHLDLADHLWDGGSEYPYHGYNFAYESLDPMDDHGHGTHCAGTVCGDGTAGYQTGMAPDATLMCVKVLDSGGYGEASVTCNAMQWAVEQGCDLFSMSLGWANATLTERVLFRNTCVAVLDAGVVGAIAAGNEGSGNEPNNVRVPGSCPPPYMDPVQQNNPGGLSCAVCVGAVDEYDYAAYFTSRGPVTWSNTEYADYPYMEGSSTEFGLIRPDVCAPGVDIVSADGFYNSGYTTMSGTSMATPCVAGCISLMLSKDINITPAEICRMLEETAVPLEEGKSNTYGYGRVDVLAAISTMYSGPLTLESVVVNDASGNNDGKLNAGESVTLDLTLTNDSEVALNGATLVLSTESDYVTITNGTATLPHFNAGQTQTIEDIFSFSLSNDAPVTTIQFLSEVFDDGESLGTMGINVMVYGHILRFEEVTVLNDNNGNSSLEAGETADLHVVISNIGNETAASIMGTLSTAFPYLTINSNGKSFGNIEIGGQSFANFNVSLSNSAPDGYTIDFLLDLVDGNAKHSELEFDLWRKAITLTSNPEGGGTLTGGGNYGQGQTCIITATANNGYVFSKWTKDGTTVSYFPTYSFEVTDEAEYVANFKQVDGIVIGDAISTNAYFPTSFNNRYSMTQQIYTATEMGGQSCQISSVSFFNTGYSSTRNLDVYLVHTDKTSFESNTDWIIVTEDDKVFSGRVTMTGYNWANIYFATPFDYDGSSNVALIVDDNSNSWSNNSIGFRVFNTVENQSIYICSSNTNYDPYNPTGYTGMLMLEKNQVVFGYARYDYTVTVAANPSEGGMVSGGEGLHYYGEPVTLTATPNEGYVFSKWTKNGSVVSCLSTYSVQVTGNVEYVANFQQMDGIAIGEATYTNSYLPIYSSYPYSLSQQIYTADELNTGSCEISSVSFFNTYYGETRNLNIFMVNTDKTAFESSTDWIALTEADLVFSGSVTTAYYNWTTVYFNTPFNYDGSSNVALVVNDWTGDWGWGTSCRTFDTEGTQAIYVYRDYDVINPYSISDCNGTLLTVKNQIVLTIPSYEYTVTLTADPEEAGTVSGGGGLYFYGQPIPVSATPNEGYAFNYWTNYNEYYGYDEVLSYYSIDNIPVTETTEFVAHFQQMDGITVGNATHSSYCLPTCSDYPYSMTQQIYTADELSFGSSSISSISFFNTGYYSYRYLSIYLVNTDKTAFEDSWDWIAVNYENQVFSGEVYFEESAWTTINFYMPFQYDGSSNLALVVCDETGDWGWGMSCRTFDSEGTQTIYTVDWYGGYIDPYYPYNYYGTLMSEKNEIVFGASSYMVTVSANPEEGGTVSGGGGPYDYGEYVAISATANPDYVFNYWSRYDEYYGYYEIVSYFSTDTISVIGSSEYIAYFQQTDGIIIGDAVSSSSYLPTSSYYSMTQQIFTASEMGGEEQAISSVSFFNMSSSKTRNLDIYMVNTNKTSFENNADWITVTEDDKVFSGNVSMTGYGWVTIYFTTPFYYDGLSNVALIVDDNSNSSSYGYYRTFGTEVCQAIRIAGSGTDYDPCNPSGYTGTIMTQKNQVVFGIASFEYMASVSASPAEGGTVSGGGGPYYYGQPIPVTATANSGYVFNKWTKNGSAVSYFSTDNVSVTETAEFVANFQQVEGIAIGEAVSDNTYLPTSSYYSMTQQIFTADEMGDEEHEISSVSFFNTSNSKTRNLDIYMVNTNKTSFESNTDWIAVTEDDKVFSGSVSISANGWATIYFATPFSYDGVSNVALIMDDNSNTYNSGLKCRTFGTEESQAIRIAGSGTNYDPYNPSSYTGTLMWEKNQVIFGFPHYEYMVTATSESTESGTVNGGGGPYYYGQPITLTAIANDGYAFVNWTKDGTVVSYLSPFTVAVTESAEYVAHFQEINGFVIGDATGTNSCLPSYSYYCYSLSQQIYTADELNLGAGKISSVAFFNTGTTRSRNYTIYLVSTNKTAFNDENDWITVSTANKVFNGNITMTSGGWTTIPFDNTFNYDGVSNIALVIDDNTGNYYYPYMYCRVYSTDCNQSIYVYSDDTNYNPLYSTNYYGTRPLVKNQIVLGMMYDITVASEPTEGGTVMGGGFYQKGSTCTVTATPAEDYYFFYWTENGQTVSFDNTYSFTVGSGRNLVAHFEQVTNNHWTFDDSGYSDNMTLTGIIQIDGVEQRSELLEIGAFCGDECRGSQRATYFAPTDIYIIQMVVFGESNDMISFRLYDHQLQQELLLSPPADVIFNTNGYGSLNNPYVLNFTSTLTHTQILNSGWNWWSTYIELNNNDGLNQLENSIGSAGIIIKSRTNGYVETYEYNGETNWYGTLNSINNEQMYMIRTNAECNAIVEGWLANPADHPININSGWNWIGFPCSQNVGVDEALSGFTPENNDIIKSRNGYSTYYSDGNYNMWYGTLNTYEPGKGYMYRSNSATQKTLVFTTGRGDGYEGNITPENNAFRPADGDFADNMTLTAVVEMDGEELRSEDYELAAFVGNECRGSVRLMYVEPVDRYIAFLTIFGEQEEELYFQLTDGIAGSLASDQIAFAADGIVGTLDNPFVLHFGTLDVDENALANVKVYPNPSEGIFNIEGQNIRKIEVFNAFGQSVYSKETANGFMRLDLTNRAAGIYLIRIVTNDGVLNHQIIKK